MGGVCCVMVVAAMVGGVVLFMTKTKKGRRITKKARRIAGEVEDIVRDELAG